MAARLNVLLVQSPRMTPLQSNINAALAVQLMGVPGLDLAILGAVAPEMANTDRLLLESLSGDLAIVDWRGPEETLLALERLGIAGSRAPHRLDPGSGQPPQGARRLYLVDLRRGDSPAQVLAGLQAILASRRVVTVSLGAPPRGSAAAAPASAPERPNVSPPAPASRFESAVTPPAADEPTLAQPAAGEPPARHPSDPAPHAASRGRVRRPQESDLDALVEEVNRGNW